VIAGQIKIDIIANGGPFALTMQAGSRSQCRQDHVLNIIANGGPFALTMQAGSRSKTRPMEGWIVTVAANCTVSKTSPCCPLFEHDKWCSCLLLSLKRKVEA